MVEWLAGNRIRGTSAEKPVLSLPSGSVGGWVEVGRTTLGSTTKPITVSSIPDKRYYMILVDMNKSGNATTQFRYGNSTIDVNNNYADRGSYNGVADGTPRTSASTHEIVTANAGVSDFLVGHIANLSAKEKLMQYHWVYNSATGVTTSSVPERAEKVGKWTNGGVSAVIDTMQLYNSQSGNYLSGSEVVVLGWDPTDTHTTNFWKELASVDLTGGAAATLSSGTFTAKKYLWVQYYTNSIASSTRPDLIFNSDTTSSYANRYNYNGTESVAPSENSHFAGVSANTNPFFANFFIINNSANEKLSIGQGMSRGGSGAGTVIAQRFELAQKWARTSGSGTGDASAQITKITLTNDASANFGTSTYLKVWGSD